MGHHGSWPAAHTARVGCRPQLKKWQSVERIVFNWLRWYHFQVSDVQTSSDDVGVESQVLNKTRSCCNSRRTHVDNFTPNKLETEGIYKTWQISGSQIKRQRDEFNSECKRWVTTNSFKHRSCRTVSFDSVSSPITKVLKCRTFSSRRCNDSNRWILELNMSCRLGTWLSHFPLSGIFDLFPTKATLKCLGGLWEMKEGDSSEW